MCSFGFYEGKELGLKIHNCFTTFRQMLSLQDHYDFGMRSIMSVMKEAQKILKENPQTREEEILFKAIKINLGARIVQKDCHLYDNILKENFSAVYCWTNNHVEKDIRECCEKLHLEPTTHFAQKVE